MGGGPGGGGEGGGFGPGGGAGEGGGDGPLVSSTQIAPHSQSPCDVQPCCSTRRGQWNGSLVHWAKNRVVQHSDVELNAALFFTTKASHLPALLWLPGLM